MRFVVASLEGASCMSPGRSVGRTSGKSIQREDCEVDFLSLPRFRMSNSVLLCPFRRPQESISDRFATQRHSFASVVLFLLSFLSPPNEIRAAISAQCSDCHPLHHISNASSHLTSCDLTRNSVFYLRGLNSRRRWCHYRFLHLTPRLIARMFGISLRE